MLLHRKEDHRSSAFTRLKALDIHLLKRVDLKLEPFLLDQWLEEYESSATPIQFHLASSTGPHWTTEEMISFLCSDEQQSLLGNYLLYSRGQGADDLREAIGAMQGVRPIVLRGRAERKREQQLGSMFNNMVGPNNVAERGQCTLPKPLGQTFRKTK